MITRVKKNKPSYNGRFAALPPLKMVASADALSVAEETENKITRRDGVPISVIACDDPNTL